MVETIPSFVRGKELLTADSGHVWYANLRQPNDDSGIVHSCSYLETEYEEGGRKKVGNFYVQHTNSLLNYPSLSCVSHSVLSLERLESQIASSSGHCKYSTVTHCMWHGISLTRRGCMNFMCR
jgi:hypothetical protein